ncbi:MAG: hypothetical protein DRQ47_06770, partial [Gammaproteobacteria bacterium]
MTSTKIIKFSPSPEGFGQTHDELSSGDFASDLPIQNTHSYFEDPEAGLYIGVWDTTKMSEIAGPYGCDEFMLILEGEALIRNCKTEQVESVKPGE